ncbi:hypothetical protein GGI25_001038 [Coemansia spiralis]|uniref:Mediator of RNA polymerase II transcription subunit 20 n=2 Tax=Coemansia TaxID=4863 RepID=A0A9W8GDR5_9FUNG|nr:mediator complex, subunit Med20 [Coemansia spiralis]KAJ1990712.1 hypothetical protein EDC05_003909 [Coemansia umbellata]KAJ2621606.1 hypothetical protein GGI26_003939 [Coemansia sp. RSA 1358]KAJ2680146.1 hypothetical protein GGI25_001038 [Coemansia spiralis]
MAGSTWVLWWKDAQGTASLGLLQERLLRGLRATLKGRWSMDTRLFHSPHNFVEQQNIKLPDTARLEPRGTASDQSLYLVVRSQGTLRRHFFVMASNRVVVEAEPEMESMVLRLKNLWTPRQAARIEGYTYEGDDWVIRTGNLMVGTSYKGLVIEINYLPCSNPEKTHGLMCELLLMILPPDAQVDANINVDYRRANLDPTRMTDRHTAYQYVHLFTQSSLL